MGDGGMYGCFGEVGGSLVCWLGFVVCWEREGRGAEGAKG